MFSAATTRTVANALPQHIPICFALPMTTGCHRQYRAGSTPKTAMKSHSDQLKKPEASEYRVLNTLPMVVASIITL